MTPPHNDPLAATRFRRATERAVRCPDASARNQAVGRTTLAAAMAFGLPLVARPWSLTLGAAARVRRGA